VKITSETRTSTIMHTMDSHVARGSIHPVNQYASITFPKTNKILRVFPQKCTRDEYLNLVWTEGVGGIVSAKKFPIYEKHLSDSSTGN
jgi:hypothetical protein